MIDSCSQLLEKFDCIYSDNLQRSSLACGKCYDKREVHCKALVVHHWLCGNNSTSLPAPQPPLRQPPHRCRDAELCTSEISKTSAKVSWRSFRDCELQYIDGVQVKYTQKNNLVRGWFDVSLSCSGPPCKVYKFGSL